MQKNLQEDKSNKIIIVVYVYGFIEDLFFSLYNNSTTQKKYLCRYIP